MTDQIDQEAELPLDNIGARLKRAREAAGLTRAQIASTTKIPERHLIAIEEGNFGSLPASTYAVGFSRSYARAVGLDEAETVRCVHAEIAGLELDPPRRVPSFEPGDPARLPGRQLAWFAALLALAVVIAGMVFWRSYYAPGASLPSLITDSPPVAASSAAPVSVAPIAAPIGGDVVFTAQEPGLWVKFSDANGKQLMQKQLMQGESYTIPAGVEGVRLWTGRPNALAITIGGKAVPKLAEEQLTMRDVPVSAPDLLARAAPAAGLAPAVQSSSAPARTVARSPQPRRATSPSLVPSVTATLAPAPAETPAAAPVASPTSPN